MAATNHPNHGDDERAARVALSQLDGIGPARLRWLMSDRSAHATFEGLCRGVLPVDDGASPRGVNAGIVTGWQAAARGIDPAALLDRHRMVGIAVVIPGDVDWPFTDDPEPPSVLYVWGDPAVLRARPTAAIVGTRRCTETGRGIAHDLGAQLADAGIDVVSGLALGIDGAAHAGTLAVHLSPRGARSRVGVPIAVVANGLDRVSPRFHRALTERVAASGAVLSESPLGTNGDRWRFPARNRLIAGLSDVVIVIESHAKGGALITVDEAIERGVPVMAVPGSIRSAASAGTNRLLAEGAVPLCGVEDVLTLLGVAAANVVAGQSFDHGESGGGSKCSVVEPDDPRQRAILAELGVGAMSIDRLTLACRLDLVDVMMSVQRLVADGRVDQVGSTVSLASEARRRPG